MDKQPSEKWGRLRKLSNANALAASMNLSSSTTQPPASPSNTNVLSPSKLASPAPSQHHPDLQLGSAAAAAASASFAKIVSPKEIHSPRPKNDSSERVMSNYEASRLYFKQSLSAAKNSSTTATSSPMNINTPVNINTGLATASMGNMGNMGSMGSMGSAGTADFDRDPASSRGHDSPYSTPRRQDYHDSLSLRTPVSSSATAKQTYMTSPSYRDASYSSASTVNIAKYSNSSNGAAAAAAAAPGMGGSPVLSSASSFPTSSSSSSGPKPFSSSSGATGNGSRKPSRPVLASSYSSYSSSGSSSCAICSQQIYSSSAVMERTVVLRCECLVHEDCLLSAVRFEKEKEKQQNSGAGSNQSHILDRVFPVCLHCGGSTRTIPKNNVVCEYFINEFLQYDHPRSNSASKMAVQSPSSPYLNQQSQPQSRRLQQSPQLVLSPSSSTSSSSPMSSSQLKSHLYHSSKQQQQQSSQQQYYGHHYNHYSSSSGSQGHKQEQSSGSINRLHLNTSNTTNANNSSASGSSGSGGPTRSLGSASNNPYQNINSPSSNKTPFKSPISSSNNNAGPLGISPTTSTGSFSNSNSAGANTSINGANGSGRLVSPLMLANNPYIRNTLGESANNNSNYHGYGHHYDGGNNNITSSGENNESGAESLTVPSSAMRTPVTGNLSPTPSSHSSNYKYNSSGTNNKAYYPGSPSIKSPLGLLASSMGSPVHGNSTNGSMGMRQPFLDSPRSYEFNRSDKLLQQHPLPPTPHEQQYSGSNLRGHGVISSSLYSNADSESNDDNSGDEDDIIAAYDNVDNYNYLDAAAASKNAKISNSNNNNNNMQKYSNVNVSSNNHYNAPVPLNQHNNPAGNLASASSKIAINNGNINMDMMQSIKAKRVAPEPPLTGKERSKHISSVISKNRTSLSSPPKKPRKLSITPEMATSTGSSSTTTNTNSGRNIGSDAPERTKSMHSLSFNILNGPAPNSSGNNNKRANNAPQLPKLPIIEDGSPSTDSFVSPTGSQESSTNNTNPAAVQSMMKRSDSVTSSLSVSTSNTQSQKDDDDFYDDADSEDEYPLDIIQQKFTGYLKAHLKDGKTDKLVLSENMLSEFGDLRLVDRLLVSANNAEKSNFKESVVYLFENRLLFVDSSYKSFISLKLNLPEKEPSVEITSTSVIKLDFSKTASSLSKSRSIQSIYISIDESQNDVIQKWCAALFDYECSLPSSIFTSTLTDLMDRFTSNDDESHDTIDDKLLSNDLNNNNNNSNHASTPHNNKNNRSSQATLDSYSTTIFDGSASRISVLSNNTSRQQSRVNSVLYTVPKSLIIIANVDSQVSGSQVSLLINIMKTISFKIPNMKIVVTKNNFKNEILSENCKSVSFMQKLIKAMTNYESFPSSNTFSIDNYLSKEPESSMLYLSCNMEFSNPKSLLASSLNTSLSSSMTKLVQVGVYDAQHKSLSQNSSKLNNDVINVPIWDNLMEAICGTYHITFDDFSENESSESESEEDEGELPNRNKEHAENNAANSEEDDNEVSDLESLSESESDGYDSDDSTKLQLLRLKKEGQLGDDDKNSELLKKYNLDSKEFDSFSIDADGDEADDNAEAFSAYEESEDSEDEDDNDSDYDSDDSTKEQLARLNQKELLEKLENKKSRNISANTTAVANETTASYADMSYSKQILDEVQGAEEDGEDSYASDFDTSYLVSKRFDKEKPRGFSNSSFNNKAKGLLDPIMFEDESVQLEEDNFRYDMNNSSNVGTPLKSARRLTRDNSPRPILTKTPQKSTDSVNKLGTPRWSTLFQDIDKEWSSLKNDDDGGFMKFSKWGNLNSKNEENQL